MEMISLDPISGQRMMGDGMNQEEALAFVLSKRRSLTVPISSDIIVLPHSPKRLHAEMCIRATCLFIHAKYEWIQWREDRPPRKHHPKDKVEGHLLVEEGAVVGAAAFWRSPQEPWRLDFVDIDPEHRRKGFLTKGLLGPWPERYGDFIVPRPWSEAARSLFEKIHYRPFRETNFERNQVERYNLFADQLESRGLLKVVYLPPDSEHDWRIVGAARRLGNSIPSDLEEGFREFIGIQN